MSEKIVAICLAAGQGKRMKSSTHKQYMLLNQKPVLFYTLDVFQKSSVDEVILVVGDGEEEYCKREIVEKYNFNKVKKIIMGGLERYHSVANGLEAICDANYIIIHDGARPLLSLDIIERCMEGVKKYQACVAAVPVKDTIKIADDNGFIELTPPRNKVWQIQTPQCFEFNLIKKAYKILLASDDINEMITDDAMVVERYMKHKVRLIEGCYENIKITTPDDIVVAERLLAQRI